MRIFQTAAGSILAFDQVPRADDVYVMVRLRHSRIACSTRRSLRLITVPPW